MTRLTSREDLGREWFWPLMAGRTSGGHIRVFVKLTAERAGSAGMLAGRLAGGWQAGRLADRLAAPS